LWCAVYARDVGGKERCNIDYRRGEKGGGGAASPEISGEGVSSEVQCSRRCGFFGTVGSCLWEEPKNAQGDGKERVFENRCTRGGGK